MRVPLPFLAILASTALALTPADPLPHDFQRGYQLIAERDLRADLTFLASDQLEGRLSLTPGSEIAVQ